MQKLPPLPPMPRMRKDGTQSSGAPRRKKAGPGGPMWRETEDGNVFGNCRGCGDRLRSMDLALVPTWTGGYWFCRECRPNAFKVKPAPTIRVRG